MENRFQNLCLAVIVILLAILVFRPHGIEGKSVSAAGPITKYRTVGVVHDIADFQLEKNLNAQAKDGWIFDGSIQNHQGTLLIFKKE
jgi:hypothetical protein